LIPLDEVELSHLAAQGLRALLPVGRLRALAQYCWDRGEVTGDARYCSLWRTFSEIAEFFEEYDALETSTVDSLDRVLKRDLGGVLRAETAETGALSARGVREEILAVLRNDRFSSGGASKAGATKIARQC
jgi:hypothetical protein